MAEHRRVVVAPLAAVDIAALAAYIADQNPTAASRLIDEIYDAINELAVSADACPERELVPDKPYRYCLVKPYHIIFEIVGEEVHVLRVAHTRRDLPALFT